MIKTEHLTRRFGAFTAVDDVSFELDRGEVVGFLGLNGAGKTTTMRMLTGFLPPSQGAVTIAGFDVLRQSLEVRKRIGYLPESVPLYREHRVGEMMRFQARLHGLSRDTAKRRIPEVLEQVELLDRERSLVGDLSKGLRQRAGLAVALLPDPDVLILDEPTSGLDPLQRAAVRRLIGDLAAERTVLLSSHILPEVEALCPRLIVLHRGRLVADGDRASLEAQLGGEGHVRFEAVVGPDAEAARRAISAIPGADRVELTGRVGIHDGFDVFGADDLREDVGALAMTRSWAVRELTWVRPSLEELFARLALGHEGALERAAGTPRPATMPTASAPENAGGLLVLGGDFGGLPSAPSQPAKASDVTGAPALGVPGKPKAGAYNLNPFATGGPGLGAAPQAKPAAPSSTSEGDDEGGAADRE